MFRLKIITLICFFTLQASSVFAEQNSLLTIENLTPAISPSKYKSPYVENPQGQIRRVVKISSFMGLEEVSMTYQMHVPKKCTVEQGCPIVTLLHGANRSGVSMIERWQELADQVGLVLVAPNAQRKIWMDGAKVATYSVLIEQIIKEVSTEFKTDVSRTYLFGHSNGGMFATLFPLYKPDLFAAVVVNTAKFTPVYPRDQNKSADSFLDWIE